MCDLISLKIQLVVVNKGSVAKFVALMLLLEKNMCYSNFFLLSEVLYFMRSFLYSPRN